MWNDWLDPFSQKLAGLLQPVINDGGRPCLTNTSRAQLSTGPPLLLSSRFEPNRYIVYMPCAQRKPSPHWSNQRHGTVLGLAKLNFLQEKRDCCITCRLSSKSRVLSEARVIVKYGCLDVSSQPPSYEDKLPYEIWGWEVQLNITWTLLLLLITIIKDYCLQEDNCGNTMVLNNHIHEGIYIVPFKSLGLVRFYAFWKSLLLLETHDAK